MLKKIEIREGEEAAERFKDVTAKIMSVPKSEIDKRAADKREKRQAEQTEQGAE
jgi:hypothetical protein